MTLKIIFPDWNGKGGDTKKWGILLTDQWYYFEWASFDTDKSLSVMLFNLFTKSRSNYSTI